MPERNHSRPVAALPCDGESGVLSAHTPGAFAITDVDADGTGWLMCECPCGCGRHMSLVVYSNGKKSAAPAWQWDGDLAAPTLAPSIRDLGGCRFHGYLRAGTWTFEGDSGSGATR